MKLSTLSPPASSSLSGDRDGLSAGSKDHRLAVSARRSRRWSNQPAIQFRLGNPDPGSSAVPRESRDALAEERYPGEPTGHEARSDCTKRWRKGSAIDCHDCGGSGDFSSPIYFRKHNATSFDTHDTTYLAVFAFSRKVLTTASCREFVNCLIIDAL